MTFARGRSVATADDPPMWRAQLPPSLLLMDIRPGPVGSEASGLAVLGRAQ